MKLRLAVEQMSLLPTFLLCPLKFLRKCNKVAGKMRTITINSPRSSHPIYFDFFKCEDANGYNCPIVRAGDMLWMAENLRKLALSDITDANNLSADVLKKANSFA